MTLFDPTEAKMRRQVVSRERRLRPNLPTVPNLSAPEMNNLNVVNIRRSPNGYRLIFGQDEIEVEGLEEIPSCEE
jgi:hypothetical protein